MDNYDNNNQYGGGTNPNPQPYTPQDYQPQSYQPQSYQPQQSQPQSYQPQGYQQPQQQSYQQNYQQPQNYQAQPYAAQQYEPNLGAEIPKEKQDGKAIASMILGIVSLVCCGGFYACPIVGLILGIVSKKNKPNNNGMAVAGIVMCCIALGFMVLYTILAISGVVQYPFNTPRYTYTYGY